MELQELFRRLSYGELSNLALGAEGTGAIVEDAQPRIITYANEALLRLHTRFLLRESLLFLGLVEHLTYYYMLKRFAVSQITDPPCDEIPHSYILDSVDEPYEEDLIKILGVIDQFGCVVPLNDPEQYKSVYTPQPNLLQVPNPIASHVLAISYQARHPILDVANLCQEIDLPFALEGALTSYIAYKVFSHMNGQENSAKGQEHLGVYEKICTEVTAQDIVSQSQSQTSSKFHDRGFV